MKKIKIFRMKKNSRRNVICLIRKTKKRTKKTKINNFYNKPSSSSLTWINFTRNNPQMKICRKRNSLFNRKRKFLREKKPVLMNQRMMTSSFR